MKHFIHILMAATLLFSLSAFAGGMDQTGPVDEAPEKSRCAVCGMFVGQYQDWLTQVHFADGAVEFFDGVKDMMAFLQNPKKYGAPDAEISDIWVSDYYTLEWLDGRKAFFVTGSDVYGPMGHELIPFATLEAATTFKKDHHGQSILTYSDITTPLIEELRSGQRMK